MLKKVLGIPKKINLLYERVQALGAQLEALERKVDEIAQVAGGMSQEVRLIHAYSSAVNTKMDRLKTIVSAGNGAVLTQFEGFVMAFPGEDYGLTASYTFADNIELGLRSLFRRTIKSGMNVVDVGANVGVYTLISGSLVGETGRVYSFEPTPRIFDLLEANIGMAGLHERVEARRMAVSDEGGKKLRLKLFKSTRNNTLFGDDGGECVDSVEVETVKLDEALRGRKIDFVKIDAEGAEPFILRGMREIIRDNPQIIVVIEFAATHLLRAGVDPEGFIKEIKGCGLSISRVDDYTGEAVPISEKELVEIPGANIILRGPVNP